MKIKLMPFDCKRKIHCIVLLIINIFFIYCTVKSALSIDNNEATILFVLCVIIISLVLYEIASPRKYKCMRAVKGKMTFRELKNSVEQESFEEPILLWSGGKSKCNRHLLFSKNWVVMCIGDVDNDPICIPKNEITNVSILSGELHGTGFIPGSNKKIVRFDTNRRWFLTGYIHSDDLEKTEKELKRRFANKQ